MPSYRLTPVPKRIYRRLRRWLPISKGIPPGPEFEAHDVLVKQPLGFESATVRMFNGAVWIEQDVKILSSAD